VAAERIFSRAKIVNKPLFSLARGDFVVTANNTKMISNKFSGFRVVDLERG
jgi:hypothetical protein